jgi:hypothetical protein
VAASFKAGDVVEGAVSIEVNGIAHTGTYTIDKGWMKVVSAYGSKTSKAHTFPAVAQIGPDDGLAQLLLSEFVATSPQK